MRWTAEQFDAALAATGEPRTAVGRATADGYPGTYAVTLDDGRFDITHDRTGIYCTGSYAVSGDRMRLVAERRDPASAGTQPGCRPGRFLDATFVLTDDGLAFSAPTAHPVDAVLFAGQPLARAEG